MVATAEPVPDDDKLYEFVDEQWVEKDGPPPEPHPYGAKHGGHCARLLARLLWHVEAWQLGGVYGSNTGFKSGLQEHAPDVFFFAAARFPAEGEPETAGPVAPDLAVEVISPSDAWEEVNRKLREYFAAGVREVWLISMEQTAVIVYHAPISYTAFLTADDELTSPDLLPGFHCRVAELFKQPARQPAPT